MVDIEYNYHRVAVGNKRYLSLQVMLDNVLYVAEARVARHDEGMLKETLQKMLMEHIRKEWFLTS